MGVETNGVPPEKIVALTETQSPDNPMAAVAQSLSGSLVGSISGLLSNTATEAPPPADPEGSAKSLSLSNLPARLTQDSLLFVLANKTETSNRDEAHDPARITTLPLFCTSSATNSTTRKYESSTPPPPASAGARLSIKTSADYRDNASSSAAKHFRFSGDFTSVRNHNVLSAFASSMGNLSDAWEDCCGSTASESVASKPRISQYCHSSPCSSANSILTELPTRFSFESSSTTSSSSSHLSLLQRPPPPVQRNTRGSFDRKDLLPLTAFQSQCEDFESYISTQINRYGSVEKLMGYASHGPAKESSKSVATDVSSLSLSPINRRRNDLEPTISLYVRLVVHRNPTLTTLHPLMSTAPSRDRLPTETYHIASHRPRAVCLGQTTTRSRRRTTTSQAGITPSR